MFLCIGLFLLLVVVPPLTQTRNVDAKKYNGDGQFIRVKRMASVVGALLRGAKLVSSRKVLGKEYNTIFKHFFKRGGVKQAKEDFRSFGTKNFGDLKYGDYAGSKFTTKKIGNYHVDLKVGPGKPQLILHSHKPGHDGALPTWVRRSIIYTE